MKKTDWKEVVGIVGVILSLLFVGYEIRQNSKVARGQVRQALAELNQQWLVLWSTDEAFVSTYRKYWESEDSVSVQEKAMATMSMTMHLRRLENVFLQFREGLVDESALSSYGLQAVNDLRVPRFKKYWIDEGWREGFDPLFVDFLEEAVGEYPKSKEE